MTRFFLSIYRYFQGHKSFLYIILAVTTAVFAFFASKIKFQENFLDILPKTDKADECAVAFGSIKVKDKVFVEIESREGKGDPAAMAAAMDEFIGLMKEKDTDTLIANTFYAIDRDDIMNIVYYAMDALPCHLGEDFYAIADTLLDERHLEALASGEMVPELPIGGSFSILDGHIFSKDSVLALAFISPSFEIYDTFAGGEFNRMAKSCESKFEKSHPEFDVHFHGAALEGVSNSHQTKVDLIWSLSISIVLIGLILGFCFKKAKPILNLVAPIIYGTLFALAGVYLIQKEMSFIALGIGALILGVALSYCLHVVIHRKFVEDVETILAEQVRPVCLGCLTTIGAFAGLFLTSSSLLKDFGLFASLLLVGTTLYALIFLPHFFSKSDDVRNEKAFDTIDRFNGIRFDRKIPLVAATVILCIVCLFTSRRVGFDSDLNHIGYKNEGIVTSQKLYEKHVNGSNFSLYCAAHSSDLDSTIIISRELSALLDSLKEEGIIKEHNGAEMFLVPLEEQEHNISMWKGYWTPEKTQATFELLQKMDAKYDWSSATGFDIPGTFKLMAEADYYPQSLIEAGVLPEGLVCNYAEQTEDGWLVFNNMLMDKKNRIEACDAIASRENMIVIDPFYYTGDMVEIVHNDFNVVLLVSSIFVFLVLLLSFRSLTISLIAFSPMFLSWYVVQGIMAIFGLEFNLINIMISSFIFGIGVDYSIFVMEGLLNNLRGNSSQLLIHHKAAIFFSGAALLIVTASLLFATHPALYSVGISTLIGMSSSILLTYVLEPLLFRIAMKSDFLKRKALHTK